MGWDQTSGQNVELTESLLDEQVLSLLAAIKAQISNGSDVGSILKSAWIEEDKRSPIFHFMSQNQGKAKKGTKVDNKAWLEK